MTITEIEKIIKTKGAVVRKSFYTIYTIHIARCGIVEIPDDYNDDSIIAICYNATFMLMNIILEHPDYFEKEYNIKERNRTRISKDLDKMELLSLPDDDCKIVNEIVELFINKLNEKNI